MLTDCLTVLQTVPKFAAPLRCTALKKKKIPAYPPSNDSAMQCFSRHKERAKCHCHAYSANREMVSKLLVFVQELASTLPVPLKLKTKSNTAVQQGTPAELVTCGQATGSAHHLLGAMPASRPSATCHFHLGMGDARILAHAGSKI